MAERFSPEEVSLNQEDQLLIHIRQDIIQALQKHFQGGPFVYLDSGSSCDVFKNLSHPDRVYKFYYQRHETVMARAHQKAVTFSSLDADGVNYIQREIGHLNSLQDTHFTPQVFNTVITSEFAIIEMELIPHLDFHQLYRIPFSELVDQLSVIEELFLAHNLYPGDVEIVWDTTQKRFRMIDLGGLFTNQTSSTPSEKEALTTRLAGMMQLRASWVYSHLKATYPNIEFQLEDLTTETIPYLIFTTVSTQPRLKLKVFFQPLTQQTISTWENLKHSSPSTTVHAYADHDEKISRLLDQAGLSAHSFLQRVSLAEIDVLAFSAEPDDFGSPAPISQKTFEKKLALVRQKLLQVGVLPRSITWSTRKNGFVVEHSFLARSVDYDDPENQTELDRIINFSAHRDQTRRWYFPGSELVRKILRGVKK